MFSASELPQQIDHDAPVFVISVATHLAGMHPQTLRRDEPGWASSRGGGLPPSGGDIYRHVTLRGSPRSSGFSQDEGINLEGIRRILHMQDEIEQREHPDAGVERNCSPRYAPHHQITVVYRRLGGVHWRSPGTARPGALPGPRD